MKRHNVNFLRPTGNLFNTLKLLKQPEREQPLKYSARYSQHSNSFLQAVSRMKLLHSESKADFFFSLPCELLLPLCSTFHYRSHKHFTDLHPVCVLGHSHDTKCALTSNLAALNQIIHAAPFKQLNKPFPLWLFPPLMTLKATEMCAPSKKNLLFT